ncbi:hypothetical protein N9K77_00800 [bacterium]|nr:hypothetical protein [bacterium]
MKQETKEKLDYFVEKYNNSTFIKPCLFNPSMCQDFEVAPVVEMVLGGFYPKGGIFNIPKALENLCLDLGVEFEFNCKIEKIQSN